MDMMHIPFLRDFIVVTRHEGRPFVLIEPLCKNLGLDAQAQVARCEQQVEKISLTVRLIWAGSNPWHGFPIEYLAWFLGSLRPRDPVVLEKLQLYRTTAPMATMEYWVAHKDQFMDRRAFQKALRNPGGEQTKPYKPRPPKRESKSPGCYSRIYAEDVAEMRRLQEEGLSLRQIGQRFGIHASTVSLCVNGKYPVNPNPKPSKIAPED